MKYKFLSWIFITDVAIQIYMA